MSSWRSLDDGRAGRRGVGVVADLPEDEIAVAGSSGGPPGRARRGRARRSCRASPAAPRPDRRSAGPPRDRPGWHPDPRSAATGRRPSRDRRGCRRSARSRHAPPALADHGGGHYRRHHHVLGGLAGRGSRSRGICAALVQFAEDRARRPLHHHRQQIPGGVRPARSGAGSPAAAASASPITRAACSPPISRPATTRRLPPMPSITAWAMPVGGRPGQVFVALRVACGLGTVLLRPHLRESLMVSPASGSTQHPPMRYNSPLTRPVLYLLISNF